MSGFVVVPSDLHSAELLGESDEKPFRPADVAEPIRVLILNHFAHELRAAPAEPLERLIEIVYCETWRVGSPERSPEHSGDLPPQAA